MNEKLKKFLETLQDLADHGEFIFRGEPEIHRDISSGFYRAYCQESALTCLGLKEGYVSKCFRGTIIPQARKHLGAQNQSLTDDDIASCLQHYGAKTNLIDFTPNLYVALFFACDSGQEYEGRIIYLHREDPEYRDSIWEPTAPKERVSAHESVFVEPPDGFIDASAFRIPKEWKGSILEYLKSKGIDENFIYNGLHGAIYYQEVRRAETIRSLKEDAAKQLKDHTKTNPSADNFFVLGNAYFLLDRIGNAETKYNVAIREDPNHWKSYMHRARCHIHRGRWDKAEKDARRAVCITEKMGPKDGFADSCINLGAILTGGGPDKNKEAIKWLKESLIIKDDAPANYHLGIAFAQLGEKSESRKYLQKAETLSPWVRSDPMLMLLLDKTHHHLYPI